MPAIIEASWAPGYPYQQPAYRIRVSFDGPSGHVAPNGYGTASFGSATFTHELFVAPPGYAATQWGTSFVGLPADGHVRPAQFEIHAVWGDAKPYAVPSAVVNPSFGFRFTSVSSVGAESQAFGTPTMIWSQPVSATGFDAGVVAERAYALPDWQYPTPRWLVNAKWGSENYAIPQGLLKVSFNPFSLVILPSGVLSESIGGPAILTQQVAVAAGFDSSRVAVEDTFATHPWQYPTPKIKIDASWVGREGYAASTGAIDAIWVRTLGSPVAALLGFVAGAIGTPTARRMLDYVLPTGFSSGRISDDAFIGNNTVLFKAPSINALGMGSAYVFNRTGYLTVGDYQANYGAFGTPNVFIQEDRYVFPNTLVATKYGTTLVADAIRWITQQSPHVGNLHGTQKIAYRTFEAKPVGTNHLKIGVPVLGFARTISAEGKDSFVAPGTHNLRLANVLEPGGFDLVQTWGVPWVSRSPRTLDVLQPEVTGRVGDAVIDLWTRYVEPQGLESSNGWGVYTHIINRIRYVGAQGYSDLRIPLTHLIENKARLLRPGVIATLTAFGDGALVAYRIRVVSPAGLNSFTLPSFSHSIKDSLQVLPSVSAGSLTQYGDIATATGGNYTQFVGPYGQRMTLWSDFTTTQTGEFHVVPAGWLSHGYGQPTAFNSDQYLLAYNEGARYTEFGAHKVYIPWDEFASATGFDAAKYGVAMVSNEVRWVEQRTPHPGGYVGVAKVGDRNRKVVPPWAVFTAYGKPTVGRNVEILAKGFDALTTDDEHEVRYDNVAASIGFVTVDRWGQAWVSRSPRWVAASSRNESLTFGVATFDLWVRYVTHSGYEWDKYREKWGDFTHIHNRNRAVSPPGLNTFRSQPLHLIYNTARALVPFVIEPPGFGVGTFIADRERRVRVDGIDSFRLSNFGNRAHNAAAQIIALGFDSASPGRPEWVESNLRTIRQHSGWVGEPGQPFVADALRWVAPIPWLGSLSRHGIGRISNYEQYVTPAGIAPPGTGAPILLGPFIRGFSPRGAVMTRYSYEHRVRNKTPQIYPPGRPYSEFGDYGFVSFLNRLVWPDHRFDSLSIPRPAVQFRTRKTEVAGFSSFRSSEWTTQIRNLLPDPPSTRTIKTRWMPTAYEDEEWRSFMRQLIGSASIRMNSVPADGFDSKAFGGAKVELMGVIVKNQEDYLRFGDPSAYLRARYVLAEGFEHKNEDYEWFGKVQMSPVTIYAPSSDKATAQAKRNHPNTHDIPHKIGERDQPKYSGPKWPWWGEAKVTHRFQRIAHKIHPLDRYAGRTPFGESGIRHRSTYIVPEEGIFVGEFGRTVLVPHTKRIRAIGDDLTEFGEQTIWNRLGYVKCSGVLMTHYGQHKMLGGVRYLQASGFAATQWGNNNPMVHYPRRFSIGGGDLVKFGVTWVSFWVRPAQMDGFDSLSIDWESFQDRMRVSVRKKILPTGRDFQAFGVPQASLRHQFIRPYMIPPPCIPCRTEVQSV